ncbi:hypothetical protein ABW365_13315 [Enterococcus avium]
MDIYLHFKDQAAEVIAFYEKVFETEPAQIMTFGQMPKMTNIRLMMVSKI